MNIDISIFLPALSLLVGALAIMMFASFKSKDFSAGYFANLFLLVAIVMLVLLSCCEERQIESFSGVLVQNNITLLAHFLILVATLVSTINLSSSKFSDKDNLPEKLVLILFCTIGALTLVASREMIAWYISLEIMSISSYALVASSLKSEQSSEAGIKYFIQGALSSAIILFAIACLYGLSGSTSFVEIAASLGSQSIPLVLLAIGMMIVGMSFKLGLVPFHYWVADVYQGASTAIVVFLSSVIKISVAFSFFILLTEVFVGFEASLSKMIWLLAFLSIVVGNLLAFAQTNLKRLFAYSAVAHTGYFSIAYLQLSDSFSVMALMNYVVFYSLVTLLSFVIIDMISNKEKNYSLDMINGLAKKSKVLALLLSLTLLALAGLPPILFGLFSKIFILLSAIQGGYIGLSIVLVLGAVIACYYYLNIVYRMYFKESESEILVSDSGLQWTLVTLLSATIIYYSIYPYRLYDFLQSLF